MRMNASKQRDKKIPRYITEGFSYRELYLNYPKKEIKIPAATAEPITPATFEDIQ